MSEVGNFLISYIKHGKTLKEQIEEERRIKNLISGLLNNMNYKHVVVDESILDKRLKSAESEVTE